MKKRRIQGEKEEHRHLVSTLVKSQKKRNLQKDNSELDGNPWQPFSTLIRPSQKRNTQNKPTKLVVCDLESKCSWEPLKNAYKRVVWSPFSTVLRNHKKNKDWGSSLPGYDILRCQDKRSLPDDQIISMAKKKSTFWS